MTLKGGSTAECEMRKHTSWYLKGIRGNAVVRKSINGTEAAHELRGLLNGFAEEMMEREHSALIVSVV